MGTLSEAELKKLRKKFARAGKRSRKYCNEFCDRLGMDYKEVVEDDYLIDRMFEYTRMKKNADFMLDRLIKDRQEK